MDSITQDNLAHFKLTIFDTDGKVEETIELYVLSRTKTIREKCHDNKEMASFRPVKDNHTEVEI
jgi:hypothetical protein